MPWRPSHPTIGDPLRAAQAAVRLQERDLAALQHILDHADPLDHDALLDHHARLEPGREFHRTIVRAAGNPVLSMSTTSGSWVLVFATAWRPSEASPTTVMSGCEPRIMHTPGR